MNQLSISSSKSQRSQAPITVLLIEDSETDCVTYTRYLQSDPDHRYSISNVDSLEEGIALWRSQSPDVVLVDVNLPDGDGLEFLEFLQISRAKEEFSTKVPVIVLTGQGDERVAVRAMKLGAVDYLVKDDITAISLQKSVLAVIEYQSIARQLARSQQQKGLLSEIALRIRQSLDLSQILQSAVDGLRQLLACDRAVIYQFQPDWSGWVTVESVYTDELAILNREIIDPCFASHWHEPYCQGRTSHVDDREDGSIKPCYAELLASIQVRANLVAPILQDEHLWGLLIAHECHQPRHWETSEIRWVQQLATQLSIAIQQATAYSQLQQFNQELEDRVAQRTATLRESEAQLRFQASILQDIHDAVVATDCNGIIESWNHGAERIFGYSAAEMIGQNIEILYDHPEQLANQVLAPLLANDCYEVEVACRAKSGDLIHIHLRLSVIRDEQGNIVRLLGASHDISIAKRNEVALMRYTQEVEDLYNNAPCGYHSLDAEGCLIRVNETELQWLGYTREEMIGRPLTDFLTKESCQTFFTNYPIFCQRGWVKDLEFDMVCKDGSILPVLINATAVTDEAGNYLHSRSTLQDIRKRKQVEQQLRQTNAELARATRLKDEFLANMSHELRTPLNSILGMSDILQEEVYGELNQQQYQYIGVINQSGQHLLSLINDILDLAKIESGTMELQPQPVLVEELCDSSLSFVKQIAYHKGIKLFMFVPPDSGEIIVDVLRIRQVLINLLSNAIKFTPEGGKVTLEVNRDPIHQKIQFNVTDTGIGIASEDMPKLFQSFMQIDSSLNRQYSGTGLGLALIKKIVELHQGSVAVESTLGQGSHFTVTLPVDLASYNRQTQLHAAGEAQFGQADSHRTNQATSSRPTEPFLILLAEDNQANIDTFSPYLLSQGYHLVVATDGQEAVSLAKTCQPDVILMDIQMPGIDGIEAIGQIRNTSELANTPIIALTALAMSGDRERCLAAGANEYLAKPVKLRHLIATIKQLCEQRRHDSNRIGTTS